MSSSQVSFLRLFRRSHYFRAAAQDDDAEEATTERKERERFAVAALAFCLRYDLKFRRHFWKKICRTPNDPIQIPDIGAEDILLEPPFWADLRLVSKIGSRSYIWVIEAKAGA